MDIKIEKKKGLKWRHLLWGLGILLLAYLSFRAVYLSENKRLVLNKEHLNISEVKRGAFKDYIRIEGRVEPISTIYLDAEESGRVKACLVEEGEYVAAGTVIIKLENRSLHQEIMYSESNLAQKENMLRQTKINFENQRIETQRSLLQSAFDIKKKQRQFEQDSCLLADNMVSRNQFLQSKEAYQYAVQMQAINKRKAHNDSLIMNTEMKQLDNDLQKMRTTLHLVYERLDHLNVRSPVAGQLGMLDAQIGQSMAKGSRIGQVNVLTDYKIEAYVDEHYIDRVRRNLAATFERQSRVFRLKIRKVYPEVRRGKFKIDLVFDGEKPLKMRSGQSYQIHLELGDSKTCLLLKRGPFFQSTGGQWIYVLDKTGRSANRREINLGKQNPDFYELKEGLEEGEKVITSSYENWADSEHLVLD